MNRITQFWQTIRSEERALSLLENDLLIERFNQYVIEAEFSVKVEIVLGSPIELVFTADGILDQFEEVVNIVDLAPELHHFKATAFRHAVSIERYHLQLSGFTFIPDHFIVNFDYEQRRFALSIALSDDVPSVLHEEAKNVAYLYLDHGLGEFYAATRIHSIEFIDHLPEIAIPLKNFILIQDKLWSDRLEHDGYYPSSSVDAWDWSSYQLVDEENPEESAFLMRNEEANSLVGSPKFSYYIKVGIPITEEQLELLYSLEERINTHLADRQIAIHVMNHFHKGIRTMGYYSHHVEVVNYIVNTLTPFQDSIIVEYAYDPSWSAYLRWT